MRSTAGRLSGQSEPPSAAKRAPWSRRKKTKSILGRVKIRAFGDVFLVALWVSDYCRKAEGGRRKTDGGRRFAFPPYGLLRLQTELRDGSYRPGPHHYFSIRDPKPRTIAVAPFRDRVVHHAVVRVLTPVFDPVFIHDSYATRKGKGTHAAIERAQQFLRRNPWYLKADVHGFFDSVDHGRLLCTQGLSA